MVSGALNRTTYWDVGVPLTQGQLDDACEAHLQQRFGEKLDFAVENSLPFLIHDGLVKETGDVSIPFSAFQKPPMAGGEIMLKAWSVHGSRSSGAFRIARPCLHACQAFCPGGKAHTAPDHQRQIAALQGVKDNLGTKEASKNALEFAQSLCGAPYTATQKEIMMNMAPNISSQGSQKAVPLEMLSELRNQHGSHHM